MPASRAISAVVQWVVSPGGCSRVRVATRATTSGVRAGMRDGRVLSQQAFNPFLHEPLLPATHACLGRPRRAHDLDGADPVGAQKHDLGRPNMLLRGVAIPAYPLKALSIRGRGSIAIPLRIAADSHARCPMGIPNRTQLSGDNH